MTQTVALTGATGFIGSNFLGALGQAGYRVKALVRRPQAGRYAVSRSSSGNIAWINGTLDDQPALDALVAGCSAVVHCAGATRGNALHGFLRVNREGTRNLLAAACKVRPAPRFLLLSSLAARYPHYSWYARSKAEAESLLLADDYAGPSPTIFRPTAVYGPGDKEMRPLFRLLRRGVLLASGPAATRLSLLHVDDLVRALLAWLQAGTAQGLFELDDGSAEGYRWQDLAALGRATWQRRVVQVRVPAALLKCAARINLLCARALRYPAMLTPGKVNELIHEDWVCDNTPLTRCTGWRPRVRLADVLESVV